MHSHRNGIPLDKRFCYACGSNKTWIKNSGYPEWMLNWVDGKIKHVLCHNCVLSILRREKRKKLDRAYKARQLYFKTKCILVSDRSIRIGVCNWCRAVAPFDTKTTHMHHEKYHKGKPLKDVIELCVSCHRKETIRLKGMSILRDKKTGRIIKPVYAK